MSFIFLITTLSLVIIYILWVLFKPNKKQLKKKAAAKKKPALKSKASLNKKKVLSPTTDQIAKQKAEQMRKDPEVISQVVRYWLNEK